MNLRILLFSLLLSGPLAAGELVQLESGESFVGDVVELTDTHLDFEVDYPTPGRRRFERSALTDRTVWRIRSGQLDRGDTQEWLALGRWARERELRVPALVAFRKAARDPELAGRAKPHIAALESALAQDLFDRGELHFVNERPASAKHYFEALLERYPSTPPAPMAKTRLEQVDERIAEARADAAESEKESDDDPETRPRADAWRAEARAVRALMRAAARERPARIEPARPVRTSRALERSIELLERAERRVRDLGAPPDDEPADATRDLRRAVRRRLVEAYVDTGYAYLMRPSLNQAEEYASLASELDPDNEDARRLHRRIIEARLLSDWDGRFPRRRRPAR